jgi:hypothetical protein
MAMSNVYVRNELKIVYHQTGGIGRPYSTITTSLGTAVLRGGVLR